MLEHVVPQGGIPVIDEIGDVLKHQTAGEGRGHIGMQRNDSNSTLLNVGQDALEASHIEMVDQAFAVGLQNDGEVSIFGGDFEQGYGRRRSAHNGERLPGLRLGRSRDRPHFP